MGNTGYGNFFFFVHVAAPLLFFECVPTPFLYHSYLFSHASVYASNTTICAPVFARLSCPVLSCSSPCVLEVLALYSRVVGLVIRLVCMAEGHNVHYTMPHYNTLHSLS
jgi:hypothetical protein